MNKSKKHNNYPNLYCKIFLSLSQFERVKDEKKEISVLKV